MANLIDRTRNTEVHDLDVTGAGEHHIGRLDVAVHNPMAVGVVEGGQNPGDDLQ